MMRTYRDMDILKIEAEGMVARMLEEFEKALMGKRAQEPFIEEVENGDERQGQGQGSSDASAEDDSQDDTYSPGEGQSQLVQRS